MYASWVVFATDHVIGFKLISTSTLPFSTQQLQHSNLTQQIPLLQGIGRVAVVMTTVSGRRWWRTRVRTLTRRPPMERRRDADACPAWASRPARSLKAVVSLAPSKISNLLILRTSFFCRECSIIRSYVWGSSGPRIYHNFYTNHFCLL